MLSGGSESLQWLIEVTGDDSILSIGPFLTDDAAIARTESLMRTHPHLGVGVMPLYSTSHDDLNTLLDSMDDGTEED